MASLIEDLQRDALDGTTDISGLLRKAFAVATKLRLPEFKAWCERELKGYEQDVPEYRYVRGILRAWNPMRGWIPVMGDARLIMDWSGFPEMNSVGILQDLLATPNPQASLLRDLPPSGQNYFNRDLPIPMRITIHLTPQSFFGILDSVRTIILEWILNLEGEGILGDGMSFSKSEKEIAEQKVVELQSVVNNITIHSMTNSTIQQGR